MGEALITRRGGAGKYKVGDVLLEEQYKIKYGNVYETFENYNTEKPLTGITGSLNGDTYAQNYLKGNLLLRVSGGSGIVVDITTGEVIVQSNDTFTEYNAQSFISDDYIYVYRSSGSSTANLVIYNWNFQVVNTFSMTQGDGITDSMLGTNKVFWTIDYTTSDYNQFLKGYSTEDGSLLKNIQLEQRNSYNKHVVVYADETYVYVVSPIYDSYTTTAHKLYRYTIADGSKKFIKTLATDWYNSSSDKTVYSFRNLPYFWNNLGRTSNYLKIYRSNTNTDGSSTYYFQSFGFYDKDTGEEAKPESAYSGCYYQDKEGVEYKLGFNSSTSGPGYVLNYKTHTSTKLTVLGVIPPINLDNAAVSQDGTIYYLKSKSLFIHHGAQQGVEIIK